MFSAPVYFFVNMHYLDIQTKAPEAFDERLPSIQPEDIDFLKKQVPELADNLW